MFAMGSPNPQVTLLVSKVSVVAWCDTLHCDWQSQGRNRTELTRALVLALLTLSTSSLSITCCSLGGALLGIELRRRWWGKGTIGALRGKDEEGRDSTLADRDPENSGRPKLEDNLWGRG